MRTAIAGALDGLTPDFTSYERPVSSPNVPCGFPFSYEVDYTSEGAQLNGCGEWTWTIVLLVSRSDEADGQTILDDVAEGSRTAIQAIPVEMFVEATRIVGNRDFGGIEYLAVEHTVRCLG
jgi:hypothetical protein